MTSTVHQVENQKAIDNALFKKLEELMMKLPNDPNLYKEDVQKYMGMFKVEFEKVQGDTMKKNQRYGELLIFLSRCVSHFPAMLGFLPSTVMSLMNELGKSLHPFNRKKSVASVMILRAKNILYPVATIQFLLRMMNLQDKQLRKMIYKYILNDIRRMNKHHQNNKINQELRKFISAYAAKNSDKTAEKSIKLMIELYRRNIWCDNRSVNIIAEGCFNKSDKIKMLASHFLISTTEKLEQLSESEDEADMKNPSQITFKKGIIKHTKNKDKQVLKQKKRAARRLRKRQIAGQKRNFMPIDLIYNPQDFAEKLFAIMTAKSTKYVHKLVVMSLLSRLIWRHRLILLPFYGAIIKFLDPKQKEVHRVLTYFAESVHELIPDDQLEALIKHIIEHFINDRCSQFSMTIGLNTLREVFTKVPSIITEQMMLYLCTYYDYRNKNVTMAAKSLINLVRQINPQLLEKKFRGKYGSEGREEEQKAVGKVPNKIAGAQLLEYKGNVPIEMDKILTDEDFKKMRKLLRKQQQDNQWKNQEVEIEGDDEQNQDQDEENEDEDDEDEEDEDDDGEQIEFDSDEELEIQKDEIDGQQDEGQDLEDEEGQGQESESGEEQEIDSENDEEGDEDESVLDLAEFDQLPEEDEIEEKKQGSKKQSKKSKKKNKEQQLLEQSSDDDDEEEEDDNPHGFLNVGQIAFYKKSKRQLKKDKNNIKENKEKFKHKPKEKKGGSTNAEKRKLKPLMMLRSKKNKIRHKEKQMKTRIKSLKTQLGKVRSGKEAKKLKNKKIITKR